MSSKEKITVSRDTYSQQVYQALKEILLSGEFKPGQVLTLRSLAERFSVSIIPVREALSQLESEGVIVRRSNRDYRISDLSYKEFNDIMDLRCMLEPIAASFACKNATGEQISQLKVILDTMKNKNKNLEKYIYEHYRFHNYIYGLSGHSVYEDVIHRLWGRIGPYITVMGEAMVPEVSLKNHQVMYETLLQRDESKLSLLIIEDLEHGRSLMTKDIFCD